MKYLELKRWDNGKVIHSGEFDVCYDTKCMSYNRKDKRVGYWKKMNFFERLWYGLKQGIEP